LAWWKRYGLEWPCGAGIRLRRRRASERFLAKKKAISCDGVFARVEPPPI
jgi:hypothetical protein